MTLAVLIPFGLQLFGGTVLNLGFVLTSVHVPLLVGNVHTVMDLALGAGSVSFSAETLRPVWRILPACRKGFGSRSLPGKCPFFSWGGALTTAREWYDNM